ncbi:NAD-dependent epimerase/dehydratase family protein [Kribbella sp. NBC_01245]|uniref:NAD-dependent epimerase/dehydratase family protein n=1 Tax=Kribbella sp. NBC_01245 TaxID=2903578 RepID=UPI002E28A6C0|nr:NAD-dependent epimerase/dehydratase family protein [Kribbella sp. NBC_01245]
MRVLVIGGTGHIGTFLVPQLVAAGHDVIVVSRGARRPYRPSESWQHVRIVELDRKDEEARGTFGAQMAALEAEAVIDLICFTEESAAQLGEALCGRVRHLLHCGTIWVHGPSTLVPTTEDSPRRPIGSYGVAKAAIEASLLSQSGLPATVIHPGHITGPGWAPINPAGHLGVEVFQRLADGQKLALPHLGMETLHHVHAADVAGVFLAALANPSASVGESFHAVAPAAMTMRGYAEKVADWFGREADLEFLPWDAWAKTVDADSADITWSHLTHSPNCSMAKADRLLGFRPSYSALDAVADAVSALIESGQLTAEPIHP